MIGANGSGKSTLLLAMGGFIKGAGTITVGDMELNSKNLKAIRSQIGTVLQNPDEQLFMPTLFEDVAFGPQNLGLPFDQVHTITHQAIDRAGLNGMENKAPHHMSAGQKRSAAIATILSMSPKIITMDEPDTSLDPRSRKNLVELLATLTQTLITATCSMNFAPKQNENPRLYIAAILASAAAMVIAAAMLSIQAGLSGVLVVPFTHFLTALCGIHLVIGIIEGAITAALLVYLRKTRPDVINGYDQNNTSSKKMFFATAIAAVLITATCLSLLASDKPDGLEYAIEGGASQTSVIENKSPAIESADNLQDKFTPLPDYSRRVSSDTDTASTAWTSFAAVTGSIITMLAIWACSKFFQRKEPPQCTTL